MVIRRSEFNKNNFMPKRFTMISTREKAEHDTRKTTKNYKQTIYMHRFNAFNKIDNMQYDDIPSEDTMSTPLRKTIEKSLTIDK